MLTGFMLPIHCIEDWSCYLVWVSIRRVLLYLIIRQVAASAAKASVTQCHSEALLICAGLDWRLRRMLLTLPGYTFWNTLTESPQLLLSCREPSKPTLFKAQAILKGLSIPVKSANYLCACPFVPKR